MSTLIHADVFFFITTIALIILMIGVIVVIAYLIKILRDVSKMSGKIKQETDVIINDVESLRTTIKDNGFGLKYLGRFIGTLFRRYKKKRREE